MLKSLSILVAVALCALQAGAAQAETRCGWFENPTPGNFWITDAHGVWWLARQGLPETPGWETADWSKAAFKGDAWVPTHPNGEYGFGCGCIEGTFGAVAEGEVRRVKSIRSLPLRQCLADAALPPPPR